MTFLSDWYREQLGLPEKEAHENPLLQGTECPYCNAPLNGWAEKQRHINQFHSDEIGAEQGYEQTFHNPFKRKKPNTAPLPNSQGPIPSVPAPPRSPFGSRVASQSIADYWWGHLGERTSGGQLGHDPNGECPFCKGMEFPEPDGQNHHFQDGSDTHPQKSSRVAASDFQKGDQVVLTEDDTDPDAGITIPKGTQLKVHEFSPESAEETKGYSIFPDSPEITSPGYDGLIYTSYQGQDVVLDASKCQKVSHLAGYNDHYDDTNNPGDWKDYLDSLKKPIKPEDIDWDEGAEHVPESSTGIECPICGTEMEDTFGTGDVVCPNCQYGDVDESTARENHEKNSRLSAYETNLSPTNLNELKDHMEDAHGRDVRDPDAGWTAKGIRDQHKRDHQYNVLLDIPHEHGDTGERIEIDKDSKVADAPLNPDDFSDEDKEWMTGGQYSPGGDLDPQDAEGLKQAIETGIEDAKGDYPDVGDSDIAHDIAMSVLEGSSAPDEVKQQVALSYGVEWPPYNPFAGHQDDRFESSRMAGQSDDDLNSWGEPFMQQVSQDMNEPEPTAGMVIQFIQDNYDLDPDQYEWVLTFLGEAYDKPTWARVAELEGGPKPVGKGKCQGCGKYRDLVEIPELSGEAHKAIRLCDDCDMKLANGEDPFSSTSSVRHYAPGGGEHAPYRIVEENGKYYVENDLGEKKDSGYDTREEALNHQRALYVNVPGAAESAEEDEKSKAAMRRRADAFDDALESLKNDPQLNSPANTGGMQTAKELAKNFDLETLRGWFDSFSTADIYHDVPQEVEANGKKIKVSPKAVGDAKLISRGWTSRRRAGVDHDNFQVCHQCGYRYESRGGGQCPNCGASVIRHTVTTASHCPICRNKLQRQGSGDYSCNQCGWQGSQDVVDLGDQSARHTY